MLSAGIYYLFSSGNSVRILVLKYLYDLTDVIVDLQLAGCWDRSPGYITLTTVLTFLPLCLFHCYRV